MRTILRTVAVTAAALCVTAVTTTSAHADVIDIGGATLTHSFDVSDAALANLAQSSVDPNTTCQITTTGTALVQRTNALVGEVYGQDMGTAVGECFSFNPASYSATVTVHVEAFYPNSLTGGEWRVVCSDSKSASSVAGIVQPLPPVALCTYAGMNPHLNRYHRAHGILTNTRGQKFESYSPMWYMTP